MTERLTRDEWNRLDYIGKRDAQTAGIQPEPDPALVTLGNRICAVHDELERAEQDRVQAKGDDAAQARRALQRARRRKAAVEADVEDFFASRDSTPAA